MRGRICCNYENRLNVNFLEKKYNVLKVVLKRNRIFRILKGRVYLFMVWEFWNFGFK